MVSTLLGGSGVVASAPKKKGGSGGSETCHFCGKRVYVVERMSAEGRFFHRSCFRCDYCNILLRLGSYVYHREGPFEGKKEEKWNKEGGNESVFDSFSSLFFVWSLQKGGEGERKKGDDLLRETSSVQLRGEAFSFLQRMLPVRGGIFNSPSFPLFFSGPR